MDAAVLVENILSIKLAAIALDTLPRTLNHLSEAVSVDTLPAVSKRKIY
jgi:hypothetical protein